jgi:hypothetical protein
LDPTYFNNSRYEGFSQERDRDGGKDWVKNTKNLRINTTMLLMIERYASLN